MKDTTFCSPQPENSGAPKRVAGGEKVLTGPPPPVGPGALALVTGFIIDRGGVVSFSLPWLSPPLFLRTSEEGGRWRWRRQGAAQRRGASLAPLPQISTQFKSEE